VLSHAAEITDCCDLTSPYVYDSYDIAIILDKVRTIRAVAG